MTQLEWKGAPGNIIARGADAVYTIQSLNDSTHVLQGFGSDEKALPELGFFGTGCLNLEVAKQAAQEIEDAAE